MTKRNLDKHMPAIPSDQGAGPWGHRSLRTAELDTPVKRWGSNRTSSYPHTRSFLGGEA